MLRLAAIITKSVSRFITARLFAYRQQFYFLQVLKSKNGKKFYAHTRWGRVGELGQSKTIGPADADAAIKEFEKKFKDKTGLAWSDRQEESKGGKKYTYLEKNYDDEDEEDQDDSTNDDSVQSKLPLPTQRLIELIFVSGPQSLDSAPEPPSSRGGLE